MIKLSRIVLCLVLIELSQPAQKIDPKTADPDSHFGLTWQHYGYDPKIGLHNFSKPFRPLSPTSDVLMPSLEKTPDFRLPPYGTVADDKKRIAEYNRPYRVSPYYKQTMQDNVRYGLYKRLKYEEMGCYCTTVYKKFTLLAGCAVLTLRHILTTASTTERVLKMHPGAKQIDEILGVWYEVTDIDPKTLNTSHYTGPARIHYHPRYVSPDNVNLTHPLPLNDVALWTTTMNMYTFKKIRPEYCRRTWASRDEMKITPTGENKKYENIFVFGYQFVRGYNKKPFPWFRYMVRAERLEDWSCPKVGWGWYFCIQGRWAPLGLDSGAGMARVIGSYYNRPRALRNSGFVGLHQFTMKLRSREQVHYFTPVDNHEMLDFLYLGFMGKIPFVFLDERFYDTHDGSPKPKMPIPYTYPGPTVTQPVSANFFW